MIKPIQLLKDSFATYKANIKNIIFMTWPIALLPIVVQSTYFYIKGNIFIAALIGIVSFVISLAIGLYLQPAIYRALQKNEDGEAFDIKAAYNFQKKNIWSFIMTGIWYVLYLVRTIQYYLIASLILVLLGVFFAGVNSITLISLLVVSVLIIVIGYLINLPKFLFYINIFFSKNIKPREVIRESIKWGNVKGHGVEAWKTLLSVILFMLLTAVIYAIVALILAMFKVVPFEELAYLGNNATYIDYKWFIINSVSNVFQVMFILPISFIILAKAYIKLFDGSSSAVETPVVEGELVANE